MDEGPPWLEETRQCLRENTVHINRAMQLPRAYRDGIDGILNDANLIGELTEGILDATGFKNGLEWGLLRVVEAARQGIECERVDSVDLNNKPQLIAVAHDYRAMLDLVLAHSRLSEHSFMKAAKPLPYWHPKEVETVLSTPHIIAHLKENGIEMDLDDLEALLTKSARLELLMSNLSNPLEAILKAAKNYNTVLTTENIQAYFKENDILIETDQIDAIFTPGLRRRLALKNLNQPLEALRRVFHHLQCRLTTTSIHTYLEGCGISLTENEVELMFPASARMSFAVKNTREPLEALYRAAIHLTQTLSTEKISEYFLSQGIEISDEELELLLPTGVRRHLAINYPKNPLEAAVSIVNNMRNILIPEKIHSHLAEKSIEMSFDEVEGIFTRAVCMKLAVGYISNPLDAAVRIAKHMTITLATDSIHAHLRNNAIDLSIEKIDRIFNKWLRLKLAINNIDNPLEACLRYAEGELAVDGYALNVDDLFM